MAAPAAPGLGGFLEAAGRSLADAQGALAGEQLDVPSSIAIAEAELEVKATVERSAGGALALRTISSADLTKGGIAPGLVSTVRIRYVAVADDALAAPSERPARTPGAVIDDVRKRADVASLDRILGGLSFEATFVPKTERWLVTARDAESRVVREVVVVDRGR